MPFQLPTVETVTNSEVAVVVDRLVIKYTDITAVNGISFTADKGRVTAILGPNGAGKTSTIEACEGLRKPTSGSVRVLGMEPVQDMQRLSKQVGVMLQEGGVYPSARVDEVVQLFCSLYGKNVDPVHLIEQCGLFERTKSSWRQLSGGERQRLSLALALASAPEVAFLDEPTAGVDVSGRLAIREIIRNMANRGCAVVLATHELDEAERVADDVIIINKGHVVLAGPLRTIRQGNDVIRFSSNPGVDLDALSAHLSIKVKAVGEGEYQIYGSRSAGVVSQLTGWLDARGLVLHDLHSGAERLEEIFQRVVGEDEK